jgi:hypothetical protein
MFVVPVLLHEGHSLSICSALLVSYVRMELALILMNGFAKG